MRQKVLSSAIYGLVTGIGVIAFLYPFFLPSIREANLGQAHVNDAPLFITTLVTLCFLVLLLEIQGQAMNAKFVALLGVLVSMNALLRFLDVAIPGPGGLSPIFFLIVLTGYVFGGRFGFLMGVLTLLVSTLITGAVGPWLPYQMLTAGWVGMTAPLCRPVVRALHGEGRRREVVVLAAFAGMWGLLFGVIMNVWFWPFAIGPSEQYWDPGISLIAIIRRYATFYAATSLAWDVLRAVGNVVLILAFGAPALKALRRFHQRFAYSYRSAPQSAHRATTQTLELARAEQGSPDETASNSRPPLPFARGDSGLQKRPVGQDGVAR
jgi:energy-coupling factor transport system substrate-specific component